MEVTNPKLNLFDAIGARISAEVPKIRTFKLFNNQFNREGAEKAFPYPALMIEFVDMNYTSKSERYQEADTNIIFHLAFHSLKTEDREIFILAQELYQSIQGFSVPSICSPFNRSREQQDTDHDSVIVWQITYTTLMADNLANRNRRFVKMTTPRDLDTINTAPSPRLLPTPPAETP